METQNNATLNPAYVQVPAADVTDLFAADQITQVPVGDLKPNQRNARTHSKKQIGQIASVAWPAFVLGQIFDSTF